MSNIGRVKGLLLEEWRGYYWKIKPLLRAGKYAHTHEHSIESQKTSSFYGHDWTQSY